MVARVSCSDERALAGRGSWPSFSAAFRERSMAISPATCFLPFQSAYKSNFSFKYLNKMSLDLQFTSASNDLIVKVSIFALAADNGPMLPRKTVVCSGDEKSI